MSDLPSEKKTQDPPPEVLATHPTGEQSTDSFKAGARHQETIDLRSILAPAQGEGELGRLAQYRVLKELGRGGMGMVFLAEDSQLRRLAAIKIMLPRFACDQTARERFLREARSAARHNRSSSAEPVFVGAWLGSTIAVAVRLTPWCQRQPDPN